MSTSDIQFMAGYDDQGHERWVVGRVVEREQRDDGEWCYCIPGFAGMHADLVQAKYAGWIRADQVRPWTQPDYSRRRRGRRR